MREDDLREALRADAAAAQVPSDVMLQKIRRRGALKAAPRWKVLTEVAAATVAVAAMVGTLVFFTGGPKGGTETVSTPVAGGGSVVTPPASTGPVPAPSSGPAKMKVYENKELEVRFNYPATLAEPKMENGVITLKLDGLDLTISRRDRTDKDLQGLVGELVGQYAQQSTRLNVLTQDIAVVNGRPAAYAEVAYVSAAAGFRELSYIIPAGKYEYLVTCGARNNPGSQLTSDQLHAACGQVLDTLEILQSQGLISQEDAVAIALKQVPEGYKLDRISLHEDFRGLDGKSPAFPIWRVRVGKGPDASLDPVVVVIDAKTGAVLDERPD